MTFLTQCLQAADKEANNKNRLSFAIGDKVEVNGIDFNGAEATVVEKRTSLIGLPLVRVKMTSLGIELSFYPSELTKLAE